MTLWSATVKLASLCTTLVLSVSEDAEGAGEKAPQLQALTALAEAEGPVPASTSGSSRPLVTPAPGI